MRQLPALLAATVLALAPAIALAQTVSPSGTPRQHINSNATTAIKAGPGTLYAICINTKGASANTATVYDNTAGSGAVLAVIDTTAGVTCLTYNAAFVTGLTVVTATGTAADLTVTYR